MVWHLFPKSKRAIHLHQILTKELGMPRSPLQNGITLFDECGIIVLISELWVEGCIAEHTWREFFVTVRIQLPETSQLFTFGHALFERYHQSYLGLTGKCMVVFVDRDVLDFSLKLR